MKFDELVKSQETAPPARRAIELRKRPEFHVGGLPTVSLLPRELKVAARGKSIKRAFVAGVVVAALVAGGATAIATAVAGSAQARVDAANATSQQLAAQLAKFRDVQALQQDIAAGSAAVDVASSTEIDWQAQIDAIEGDMPTGWTVTSIQGDSASPVVAYPQGATPLELPRAASLQMSIASNGISTVGPWLRKLRTIPAYADATASVIAGEGSDYTIQLTLHLSPKALETAGKAAK